MFSFIYISLLLLQLSPMKPLCFLFGVINKCSKFPLMIHHEEFMLTYLLGKHSLAQAPFYFWFITVVWLFVCEISDLISTWELDQMMNPRESFYDTFYCILLD